MPSKLLKNRIQDLLNDLGNGCWHHGIMSLKISSKHSKNSREKDRWGNDLKGKCCTFLMSDKGWCSKICDHGRDTTNDNCIN